MKKITHTLFCISLLTLPIAGQAEILLIEDAIETDKLSFSLDAALNGHITAKHCTSCPSIRLIVDKNTQAIKHGKAVHLNKATQIKGTFATVIFDPKTKIVKRITW